MPKLINPNTGDTVYATAAGAAILVRRGYLTYSGGSAARSQPPEPTPAGWPATHAELDAIAESLDGFEWPAPPEGKKKLTTAQKIEALAAVGYDPAAAE